MTRATARWEKGQAPPLRFGASPLSHFRPPVLTRSQDRFLVLAVALGVLAVGGCGRDDPARLLARARADWQAKRLDQAADDLDRLARLRPLDLRERLFRAQVERDRGRPDRAVVALGDVAPGMSPSDAGLLLASRGTLELVRYRFRDAETVLLQALEVDPGRAEARRELANLYGNQGRTAEMRSQYAGLARAGLGPRDFAEAYLWTIGRREDAGPAELADVLRRAVTADPADHESRLALADTLRHLGRLDEADQALAPLPATDPRAQAVRARTALDRGQTSEAEALLDETADASPPLARLRGRLALARGDAEAAIEHFQAVLAADPIDRDALSGLGQALRLAGKPTDARAHVEKARMLDQLDQLVQNARPPTRRGDPAVLRAIGDACLALDRPDEARAWYRLALDRDPLDGELQKLLYRLRTP